MNKLFISTILNYFRSVETLMMHTVDVFRHCDCARLDAQIVELPYAYGEYSMVVALPNTKGGIWALERNVGEVLTTVRFTDATVHLTLPKFSAQTSIRFKPILQKVKFVFYSNNGRSLKLFS